MRALSAEGDYTSNIICALSGIPLLISVADDIQNQECADEAPALIELSADTDAIEDMIEMGIIPMLV